MKIYSISFLISIVMMTLSGVAIFNILECIDPPITEDGHRYMPTENMVKSFFLSIIAGAVIFIFAIRLQRQRQKR